MTCAAMTLPALPSAMPNLSTPIAFLTRPQLLTRVKPFPVGRDIPRSTSTPEHPCVQPVAPLRRR